MFRKKSNVFQKMKILLIENCLLKIDFWMNNQSKTIFFYNINNNNKFANFNLLYWPKISSKFPIPLIVWHSLFGQNNKWNFGIVHRVSNIDIVSKNLFNFIHKQYRLKKICLNGDDNAFGHRIFPTDSYVRIFDDFVWNSFFLTNRFVLLNLDFCLMKAYNPDNLYILLRHFVIFYND